MDSSLGVTRLEPARVHWRAGSILLESGWNRGPRADSIPLAARVGSSRGPRADSSPLALMSLIDQTSVTSDCHNFILLAAPRPTFYHYVLVSCHAIDYFVLVVLIFKFLYTIVDCFER